MFEARRSSISVLSDGQPRSKNASMSTPLPLELLQAWRVAKRKPSDAHEAVIHTKNTRQAEGKGLHVKTCGDRDLAVS
jgi:hypothetical protein